MAGPSDRRSISTMPETWRATSTLSAELLAPCEGHIAGERGAVLGGADRAVEEALEVISSVWERRDSTSRLRDRHQQVVEVMCHAAGELTQALELLHLVHLGQRHFPLARALLDPLLQLCIAAPAPPSARRRAAPDRR